MHYHIQILNAEAFPAVDGVKRLRRILNLCYRTEGRDEDYQDWVQTLITRFEAFMKKLYYLREGFEIAEIDGKKVQFLDAAKAVWLNQLYYSEEPELSTFKAYYKVLHDLRNEASHKAPEIPDDQLKSVLHLTVAIYLYTTMINLRRLKTAGLAG